MLWKVAIHGGHLHPDFIRGKLTDKQLHEIAWYYELHPFGHEINHTMMAMMIASFAGGKPEDYMPKINTPQTTDELMAGMGGLSKFLLDQDIDAKEKE
jgi:hypothetical protein